MNDRAALVAAARFERDRRAANYPARIGAGQLDVEAAAIDYQCWVAIAEWLETDRFYSFAGGADPERDDAPIVSWPELEAAAAKALTSIKGKVQAEESRGAAGIEQLHVRCARLNAIHRRIRLRRLSIDQINAELRGRTAAAA